MASVDTRTPDVAATSGGARGTASVISLPRRAAARQRQDAAFLPAALEIVETPASPLGRAIGATIVALIAAALAWSYFGQVDIIATAEGRIIPTGRSKVIQPYDTGVVRAIRVRDGQVVKVGDVLIELDPTSDASDGRKLTYALAQDRLDIGRLKSLLDGHTVLALPSSVPDPRMVEVAQAQMDAQAAEHMAKLDTIDRQTAQKAAEGRAIKAAVDKLKASLPLISEQRDIRGALLGNQFGSRLTYLQTQQQVVETQHELEAQQQRQEENAEAASALLRQRTQVAAEYRKSLLADLAKAEVQAREHEEDIAKAAMRRELRTLRAPVAGTVQQLAVNTLGGIVTPAQPLLVIVPQGVGLEIEATLANRDVGFVHKGEEVAIKVETFDFTRYGLLHGRVDTVSQDVVAANDDGGAHNNGSRPAAADHATTQPFYVAHIALHEAGIRTEQGIADLEPGMAVTAEITTGRRSILEFLLSPVTRMRKEALHER